ncbi:hypothetical protein ACNBFH_004449 [Salmonella enterica subsp. enterica serovar Bareilly]
MRLNMDLPAPLVAALEAVALQRKEPRNKLIAQILIDHFTTPEALTEAAALRESIREIEQQMNVLPGIAASIFFAPPPLPPSAPKNEWKPRQFKPKEDKAEMKRKREAEAAERRKERRPYLEYIEKRLNELAGGTNLYQIIATELNDRGMIRKDSPWTRVKVSNFYTNHVKDL